MHTVSGQNAEFFSVLQQSVRLTRTVFQT